MALVELGRVVLKNVLARTTTGDSGAKRIGVDQIDADVPAGSLRATLESINTKTNSALSSSASLNITKTANVKPTNTPAQNRTNLIAALSNSKAHFDVPAGDYPLDNATMLTVNNFEGTLDMEPGARWVFQNQNVGGFDFVGGTGATFINPRYTYATLPAVRQGGEGWQFRQTTDTRLYSFRCDGSPQAGLVFWECIRHRVYGGVVKNTMADGVHNGTCEDGGITDLHTFNTGDDGLAFVNYGNHADKKGGFASRIAVRQSKARGITIIGQSDFSLMQYHIDGTRGSGLMVFTDTSFGTRTPDNVKISNGTILNAGQVTGIAGNKYGAEITGTGHVKIESTDIRNGADRGVQVHGANVRTILKGVTVSGVPSFGFHLTAQTLILEDLLAEETGSNGYYIHSANLVEYGTLHALNTSKTDALQRAFHFENNVHVQGGRLFVTDLQATPTGFRVLTTGVQAGSMGTISARIPNASASWNLWIQNDSGLHHANPNTSRPSGDRGDASVTLAINEAPIQQYKTNLTANRTVTLPSIYHEGAFFHFVRTDQGVGTLAIGALKTMNNRSWCRIEADKDGWYLHSSGAL